MRILIYLTLLLPIFTFSQCFTLVGCELITTYSIKQDGTLWAWGNGVNLGTDQNYPLQLGTATNWIDVSGRAALKNDGTLWYFYSPNGTFSQIENDANWQSFSSRNGYTMAIKNNNTLWARGANNYGQLGDGTTVNKTNFIQIGSNDWAKIYAGANSCFAIKFDGTLWAWGLNYYGQLGDGTTINKLIPTQIGTDTDWNSVSICMAGHTLALKNNGTLWAWGNNNLGQLGNGTFGGINGMPMQVGIATDWAKIASNRYASFALKQNGTLWSWGGGAIYTLGDGSTSSRNIPAQVGSDTNWSKINTGLEFTTAIKTNNTLWVWGYNSSGQLGIGTNISQNFPVQVSCFPLNTNQFNKDNFTLYPNPTKQFLNIENTNIPITKMVVIDMLGKKVVEQNDAALQIDVSQLQNGLYVLQVYSENGVFSYKFVKE